LSKRGRSPDQLRDIRRERAKPAFTTAERHLRLALGSAITHDLQEARLALQGHHHAASPKPRAILPGVPALVLGTAFRFSRPHLFCRDIVGSIFWGKDQLPAPSDYLVDFPAQQYLSTRIPAGDAVVRS
jgi:hypothetical protein